MKKRGTALLTLAGAAGVAALVAAEIGVRLFAPRVLIHPLGIVLDRDLIYRLPPNASGRYGKQDREWLMDVRTNSRGLRDREIPYARSPGVRILGLGDSMSFAEGAAIEEIFYKKLETSLQRKSPAEVVNAAIRGWGPDQQLAYFEKEGHLYHPDVTLIAFYSGNDFEDVIHGNLYRLEDGRLTHRPASRETSMKYDYYYHQYRLQNLPLYGWLMARSHLLNLLRQVYGKLAIHLFYQRADAQTDFHNLSPADEERAWSLVKAIYGRFFEMPEKTGRVAVILIPIYTDVMAGRSDRIERLEALCRARGVPCLNLLPDLLSRQGELNRLFFPKDQHFTPAGHAWVAAELEDFLAREVLPGVRKN